MSKSKAITFSGFLTKNKAEKIGLAGQFLSSLENLKEKIAAQN